MQLPDRPFSVEMYAPNGGNNCQNTYPFKTLSEAQTFADEQIDARTWLQISITKVVFHWNYQDH